jgi:DNA mismatch endonuclease, patch repair protein
MAQGRAGGACRKRDLSVPSIKSSGESCTGGSWPPPVVKDRLSKERRSWNMSRIRGKNTTPEMAVRRALFKMGYRFRLHDKKLPGRPDIVLPKYKTVIFVHGCFWHRHRGCKNCTTPTNRRRWWVRKLEGNAVRDKLHKATLRRLGWRVLVIWECDTQETKGLVKLQRKIAGAPHNPV